MRYASTILYVPDVTAAVDFYGVANGTLIELGEPVAAG